MGAYHGIGQVTTVGRGEAPDSKNVRTQHIRIPARCVKCENTTQQNSRSMCLIFVVGDACVCVRMHPAQFVAQSESNSLPSRWRWTDHLASRGPGPPSSATIQCHHLVVQVRPIQCDHLASRGPGPPSNATISRLMVEVPIQCHHLASCGPGPPSASRGPGPAGGGDACVCVRMRSAQFVAQGPHPVPPSSATISRRVVLSRSARCALSTMWKGMSTCESAGLPTLPRGVLCP